MMSYKERDRFIRFYTTLFKWDMIEAPEAASGVKPGDTHPMLICATGPSQPDYEGAVAGHMTMFVHHAPEELFTPGPFMEIHMDQPLDETLKMITDNGGKIITDKKRSAFAKEPTDEGSLVPLLRRTRPVICFICGNALRQEPGRNLRRITTESNL